MQMQATWLDVTAIYEECLTRNPGRYPSLKPLGWQGRGGVCGRGVDVDADAGGGLRRRCQGARRRGLLHARRATARLRHFLRRPPLLPRRRWRFSQAARGALRSVPLSKHTKSSGRKHAVIDLLIPTARRQCFSQAERGARTVFPSRSTQSVAVVSGRKHACIVFVKPNSMARRFSQAARGALHSVPQSARMIE